MTDLMTPSSSGTPEELRHRINDFEQRLLEGEQLDIPVIQYFGDRVYLRRIDIPAGVLLTGRIHKFACLSIIAAGEVEVVTENGGLTLKAPCVYASPPGAKRCLRALSDVTWITAHHYDGPPADPETMADHFTVETFAQLEAFQQALLEETS